MSRREGKSSELTLIGVAASGRREETYKPSIGETCYWKESVDFVAGGDPRLAGEVQQSPAVEGDTGSTMEEREPPPRCGTCKGRNGKGRTWER